MRKLIFALIEAGQNLARRRRKILTFRRGDPLEIDQFWCLPEYKLVKFWSPFCRNRSWTPISQDLADFGDLKGGVSIRDSTVDKRENTV